VSAARKTFLVIFGLGIVLGLVIGITKMVAPDAANVTFNGEQMTGWAGLVTALLSAAIPAAIFGLIIGGIVKLFTRKPKSVA
jgi:membrane associated rhomboid family serine protease